MEVTHFIQQYLAGLYLKYLYGTSSIIFDSTCVRIRRNSSKIFSRLELSLAGFTVVWAGIIEECLVTNLPAGQDFWRGGSVRASYCDRSSILLLRFWRTAIHFISISLRPGDILEEDGVGAAYT